MKNYSDALQANAISHRRNKAKLSHIQIHQAENGGHVVEHHFDHEGGYREPQQHVFGEGDGKALMAHVAKHMGIKGESAKEEAEEGEGTAAL